MFHSGPYDLLACHLIKFHSETGNCIEQVNLVPEAKGGF